MQEYIKWRTMCFTTILQLPYLPHAEKCKADPKHDMFMISHFWNLIYRMWTTPTPETMWCYTLRINPLISFPCMVKLSLQ